jgi:hypothetical protein
MHTGLSSQVTGFYAQKKVRGILSRKLFSLAPGPARPDPRPNHPGGPDRSGGRPNRCSGAVFGPGRIRPAGRRTSGLQLGPDGPSGPESGAAELTTERRPEQLPTPDFHPYINTPSPSWGRVRTSPTIVHL